MAGHDMEKFAKLSTRLWQNEKVRVFAMEHPSAFSVWTFAISYCAGELNDGELSRFHLKCLLGASDEDIDALIDAHLLDEHEDGTLWLHDFVAAQGRSRADVEEAKAKKAEAGRKGGAASGKSRNVKQDSSKTKQTRSRLLQLQQSKQEALPYLTKPKPCLLPPLTPPGRDRSKPRRSPRPRPGRWPTRSPRRGTPTHATPDRDGKPRKRGPQPWPGTTARPP